MVDALKQVEYSKRIIVNKINKRKEHFNKLIERKLKNTRIAQKGLLEVYFNSSKLDLCVARRLEKDFMELGYDVTLGTKKMFFFFKVLTLAIEWEVGSEYDK